MHSSNECPPGQFYSVLKECRECELVCGDQYGGPATVECQNSCPGYGQSTHATTLVTQSPSSENDFLPWWIWAAIAASLAAFVVLIFAIILAVCLKKRRKCQKKWLQATGELDSPDAEDVGFVTQESNQSGKAVMVVS